MKHNFKIRITSRQAKLTLWSGQCTYEDDRVTVTTREVQDFGGVAVLNRLLTIIGTGELSMSTGYAVIEQAGESVAITAVDTVKIGFTEAGIETDFRQGGGSVVGRATIRPGTRGVVNVVGGKHRLVILNSSL